MPEFPGTGDREDGQTEDVRDQLLSLSNRGKIKSTEKFLKKATAKQLDRIMSEYKRRETEAVDDLVSKHIIGAVTNLMRSMEYVDDEGCEEMKDILLDNDLVKRDLAELSGYVTRNIKYIGIATMLAVTGGYVLAKRYGKQTEHPSEQASEGQQDCERRETS